MMHPNLTSRCVLIVDDDAACIELLREVLAIEGYRNLVTTTDPRRVAALCDTCQPDLVLLDLHMPHVSGLGLLQQLTARHAGQYLPVLMLTGDATAQAKREALEAGAKDFLSKPFDATEILLRVRNLLETRALYQELKQQNETLDQRVRERTRQLAEAQVEALDRLAAAAEYRDDSTGQHSRRVGVLAGMVARALGRPEEEAALLQLAAPLHDIGKIGVPDRILLKPGSLTPEEFHIMRSHATVGGEILARSKFPVLSLAREIALTHHERWDGNGYPLGLSGEQIPLSGRITAVVDVFDALLNDRPYKQAWTYEKAVAEIRKEAGRFFDPKVVAAFLSVVTSDPLKNLATAFESEPPVPVRALTA